MCYLFVIYYMPLKFFFQVCMRMASQIIVTVTKFHSLPLTPLALEFFIKCIDLEA